ncbi:hypothetical protein GA0115255_110968 [Streptomyces sp. Ncost-T6T-2b]|nr:hypothetical protein GA0115255_110968 [Streptomyces sp. Ncost-T6T-2b]
MGLSWNDRRLERRVKPGDGKPLKPFRWWQMTRRSLLSLPLPVGGGLSATYTVEVKHGGDPETGVVRARLYRDGLCEAESKLPARFAVPGGTIEVRRSEVGMRRCHFVADDDGSETRLVPDPARRRGGA